MVTDQRSPQFIVKKNRDSGEGRDKLVRTADVRNVVRQLGLKLYQKSEDDSASVQLWVDEAERVHGKENSPFFAYQPVKDGNMDIFCLGIMTEFQKNMLIELSDKAICVDGTHHLTQYKHQLVTVQIIDENGNGFT